MGWKFTNDKAIYLQIAEHIQMDVLRGIYPPGSQLPTVRELALEAAVNPNTMQRAYTELEAKGLVSAQRTTGRFVTEDTELLTQVRRQMAIAYTDTFLQQMNSLGLTPEEAKALLIERGGQH